MSAHESGCGSAAKNMCSVRARGPMPLGRPNSRAGAAPRPPAVSGSLGAPRPSFAVNGPPHPRNSWADRLTLGPRLRFDGRRGSPRPSRRRWPITSPSRTIRPPASNTRRSSWTDDVVSRPTMHGLPHADGDHRRVRSPARRGARSRCPSAGVTCPPRPSRRGPRARPRGSPAGRSLAQPSTAVGRRRTPPGPTAPPRGAAGRPAREAAGSKIRRVGRSVRTGSDGAGAQSRDASGRCGPCLCIPPTTCKRRLILKGELFRARICSRPWAQMVLISAASLITLYLGLELMFALPCTPWWPSIATPAIAAGGSLPSSTFVLGLNGLGHAACTACPSSTVSTGSLETPAEISTAVRKCRHRRQHRTALFGHRLPDRGRRLSNLAQWPFPHVDTGLCTRGRPTCVTVFIGNGLKRLGAFRAGHAAAAGGNWGLRRPIGKPKCWSCSQWLSMTIGNVVAIAQKTNVKRMAWRIRRFHTWVMYCLGFPVGDGRKATRPRCSTCSATSSSPPAPSAWSLLLWQSQGFESRQNHRLQGPERKESSLGLRAQLA